MPQLEKLKILDLLGVFYQEGAEGAFMVADEFDGTQSVQDRLTPFAGQTLRVLAHHRPREPLLKDRWGGGCCLFEGSGTCPAGHHADPHYLYTFNAVGLLTFSESRWAVQTEKGQKELDLSQLVGHRSQITLINMPNLADIEAKVKGFDPGNMEGGSVEDLIRKASDLRDFLVELQSAAKDVDV